jgi:hypothetical protein
MFVIKMIHTGFYKLNGHIPWANIAENPSNHLKKHSRPHTNHKLEEPSHMKSNAVDTWLGHWLKIQKKDRRPLVLKNVSDGTSDKKTNTIAPKQKGNKGKDRYVEPNDSDDEDADVDDGLDGVDGVEEINEGAAGTKDADGNHPNRADKNNEGDTTAKVLPPLPKSAATTCKVRRDFLTSLSDDRNYKKLLLLLYAAKVCH